MYTFITLCFLSLYCHYIMIMLRACSLYFNNYFHYILLILCVFPSYFVDVICISIIFVIVSIAFHYIFVIRSVTFKNILWFVGIRIIFYGFWFDFQKIVDFRFIIFVFFVFVCISQYRDDFNYMSIVFCWFGMHFQDTLISLISFSWYVADFGVYLYDI